MKNVILIVLAFSILILGLFLPAIASELYDGLSNTVQETEMSDVTLNVSQDMETMSVATKLNILANGIFVDVAISEATANKEYMIEAVKEKLKPYYESELLPDNTDLYIIDGGPRFGYYYDDPKTNIIVWVVSLQHKKRGVCVDLIIDEETEKILFIDIMSNEEPINSNYEDSSRAYTYFENIYFSELGLEYTLVDNGKEHLFAVGDELLIGVYASYNGLRMNFNLFDAETMQ